MSLNPIKFLERYQIQYDGPVNGWINTQCPFCNDHKQHGGFHINGGNYNCFKCGKHPVIKTIAALLNISEREAYKICKQNGNKTGGADHSFLLPFEQARPTKTCILPRRSAPLLKSHRKYLKERGFDPDKLVSEWGLLGTDHRGLFMKRIIIPIKLNGKTVCYTTRDITGQAEQKYKSCKLEDSEIPLKDTLYGIDKCRGKKTIVVEGPMDVWRLGLGTVASFGTQFTNRQLQLLVERFRMVYIMFDLDEAGQEATEKLFQQLEGFGIDCGIIELEKGDPADLTEEEAEKYRRLIR